jgi:hypothetical protein
MIRPPAVAGTFYSASPEILREEVARYCVTDVPPAAAIAVVSPHAGLKYSGRVAGAVFARVAPPETVILIGPNHTGIGPAISVYPEGTWLMPWGEVPVDQGLVLDLLDRFPGAQADASAHRFEHCLEVQLPFLQHIQTGRKTTEDARPLRIVPVVMSTTGRELCLELGRCLADLIQQHTVTGRDPPLLIASTDMNHYESDEVTRRKDAFAVEAIRHLDPQGLEDAVRTHEITMCGLGPTMSVLHAARLLGRSAASLVGYATSADVSGDCRRVVGYAGFILP